MLILGFFLQAIAYCIFFTPIYILFRLIWCKTNHIPFSWKRELLMFFFAQFLFTFLSQTLTPFSLNFSFITPDLIKKGYLSANLIPFKTVSHYWLNQNNINTNIVIINLLANLLITVPLGFFLPLLWQKFRKFWKIFLYCTILIIAIEALQPLLLRSADIDDYILNILGISLGYAIWKMFSKIKNK